MYIKIRFSLLSDSYIGVKERTSVTDTNNVNRRNKKLIFKNNTPIWSYMSQISNILISNAGGLDVIMPMYNLLEYSANSSMTSGNLWNYYRDEVNDDADENYNDYRLNNSKTTTSKSFEYKTKIIGRTPYTDSRLDADFNVPLKHLSNFWKSLDLINCEIELDLRL